jgi:hypothetical protein
MVEALARGIFGHKDQRKRERALALGFFPATSLHV